MGPTVMADTNGASRIETPPGAVEYRDEGDGPCVLFVHGSPGGCDQGSLMTRFLRERGWRTIALSRPGYLGTGLTDANRTPDAQAALAAGLLDALGVDRCVLMCWSGGGPSAYRLAATARDRVTSVVAIAAVSSPFDFEGAGEEKLLMGGFGRWLMKELVRHAPKETVKSLVSEHARSKVPHAELVTIADGTHVSIWTDPDASGHQDRIATFLVRP